MIRYLLLLITAFQFFSLSGKIFSAGKIDSRAIHRPVFIGSGNNIIQQISVSIDSSDRNSFLREIIIETGDLCSGRNIRSVSILNSTGEKTIISKSGFRSGMMRFKLNELLHPGENNYCISCTVSDEASIDKEVLLRCKSILINEKKIFVDKKFNAFSVGVIVRKPGDNNASCYRIPGLAVSIKGTLLAAYDVRYSSCADLPGNIDVGLSRSIDKGKRWQAMRIIMDMGEPQKENGIGDPSILIDKQTGTIWVAALWSHGNNGWSGSRSGLTPDETGQLILVRSDDDGISWSEPINITDQIKNPSWRLFFQGPGNGISTSGGMLVFPAQFRDSTGIPFSTIIYSRDRGKTWNCGTGAKSNTTEAQVVELKNGTLMLNMRDNRGEFRSIATTTDTGRTWVEHASSRIALRDPVCMASLIRINSIKNGDENNILAFSNPDDSRNRNKMTIKLSLDGGMTWGKEEQLLYDERSCFGYSSLTRIDDDYLGVLYEGNGELNFIKIKLGRILHE
jgi:sialidase-1